MALSVVDLYKDILPRTNCGDCGFTTCIAFAGMVVSEKHPLEGCPHLSPDVVDKCRKELEEQYAAGKWLKKDMAGEALQWAREKSASMKIEDLPERLGGRLVTGTGDAVLELPYFNSTLMIAKDGLSRGDGKELDRWEQVFIYNHMAQGGKNPPKGNWKGFVEFPNTVSKIISMKDHVEKPIIQTFKGRTDALIRAARGIGGEDISREMDSNGLAIRFTPLPRVPVILMFWDEIPEEAFEAQVKLLFDETVTEHLDIESIVFLSEKLKDFLCEETAH